MEININEVTVIFAEFTSTDNQCSKSVGMVKLDVLKVVDNIPLYLNIYSKYV